MTAGAPGRAAIAGLFIHQEQTIIDKALPCPADHSPSLFRLNWRDVRSCAWRRGAEGGRGAVL